MIIKRISGACFFLAMLLIVLQMAGAFKSIVSNVYLSYGIIALGGIAIFLNLLNVNESKHNISYSIVYWIACLISFVGIGMLALHLPIAHYFIYVGCTFLLISFFIPKNKKVENKNEDDLLDNF